MERNWENFIRERYSTIDLATCNKVFSRSLNIPLIVEFQITPWEFSRTLKVLKVS